MDIMAFNDARIDAVRSGAPLTPEERAWLLDDVPRFEECTRTQEELVAMNDATLMTYAVSVWTDYCR